MIDVTRKLATVLLASLLSGWLSTGALADDQATFADEPVTTEELADQFQFLLEQVQQHPDVKKLAELMNDGEWRSRLGSLVEEYSESFSHLASEAGRELGDLEQQLRILQKQAEEVFAEGNPYDDPIGKAQTAVQQLEKRMQEQKEQLDSL